MPTSSFDDIFIKFKDPIITPSIISFENVFENKSIPKIKNVHFNPKTGHTAIVWADGSESTVVRCGSDEKFEPYAGFCAAIVKKLFGSTTAAKRAMDEADVDKVAARKLEAHKAEVEKRLAQEKLNHDRKVRSMAKRMKLNTEAAELYLKEMGLDSSIENLIAAIGNKDGDSPNVS